MANDFSDIIPVLVYEDIRSAHDFLVDTLGFTPVELVEDGEGTVIHGEVRAAERRIWLHLVAPDHGLSTPETLGGAGGGVVVHVADVDAHFEHAREAGATILKEPTDQDYGQREYGVRDPGGHSWWIATPIGPTGG
jgi:uncharacterized glyoxalase superfamily protein PhnB